MEPTQYTPQEIAAWETRILEEINQKQEELFKDQNLKIKPDSDLGNVIKEFVMNLIKDFPRDEYDNVFISSNYTAIPQIVVKYSDLQSIVESDNPENLFATEVGKTITISAIANEVFGTFIPQPTRIELRDIEFPADSILKPNEWTKQKVQEESSTSCINSTRTVGVIDIDPKLETLEIKATVRCGDFETREQSLTLETRDRMNAKVIIPLPHLTLSAKIEHDGSVTFPNGKKFTLAQTFPPGHHPRNLICLNSPFNVNLNFEVEPLKD